MAAIDVSPLVDSISGVALPIAAVSIAVLGIYVLIFGFKSVRAVMGFSGSDSLPTWTQEELDELADSERHLYDHVTGLAFDSPEYKELLQRFEAGMPDSQDIESSMISAQAYLDLQRHYADDNHEAWRDHVEANFSFEDTIPVVDGKFELVDSSSIVTRNV